MVKNKQTFFLSIPVHERRITVASLISLMRLLLAPLVAFAIIKGQWAVAGFLFLVAALSDVLDGAVARFFNQKTFLGEWLDALADKVLIVCSFTALLIRHCAPTWFLSLVLVRELALIGGAWWYYCQHGHFSLEPMPLAKVSMTLYVGTILLMLFCQQSAYLDGFPYYLMMMVTSCCAFVSLMQRCYQGIKLMFRIPVKEM